MKFRASDVKVMFIIITCIRTIIYIYIQERKTFLKNEQKSRDAAAKKYGYKRSRDYEEIYISP